MVAAVVVSNGLLAAHPVVLVKAFQLFLVRIQAFVCSFIFTFMSPEVFFFGAHMFTK
jgi:hypothetical protein